MKIVVETPYGPITSIDLDEEDIRPIRESLHKQFERMTHLNVETSDGTVFIPKRTLSQSIVRFPPAASDRPKRRRTKAT